MVPVTGNQFLNERDVEHAPHPVILRREFGSATALPGEPRRMDGRDAAELALTPCTWALPRACGQIGSPISNPNE